MASDPGGYAAAERARMERARAGRASSRAQARQRKADPLEYERDNIMAGVAYRFAAKTKDAANDHRRSRGQGTETLDDTNRRAIKIAARWKATGVTDEQLNRIDAMPKEQIIERAGATHDTVDDWDVVDYGDDEPATILYYND